MANVVFKEKGEPFYRLIPDMSCECSRGYMEKQEITERMKVRAPYIDMLFGTGEEPGELVFPITSDSGAGELLVGLTEDAASRKALGMIAKDEWIICEIEGKLVVTGWFDNATVAAVRKLYELATGSDDVILSLPIRGNVSKTDYNTDIPDCPYGVFMGGMDCDEGILTFCYEHVEEADFIAYSKELENYGYQLYQENCLKNSEDIRNHYKTFVKDDKLVHISYQPKIYKGMNHELRIVTDFTKYKIPTAVENRWTQEHITPKLSLVNLSVLSARGNAVGACLIFTLSDGSFLVQDGGGAEDAMQVYRALSALNERSDGKIIIAAWILTHGHTDHVLAFQKLAGMPCAKDIVIERVIYNKLATSYGWGMRNASDMTDLLEEPQMRECLKGFDQSEKTQIIHAHVGQQLYIRDAIIDVLYNGEENLFPIVGDRINDFCLIVSVKLGAEKTLLLADAGLDTGNSVLIPALAAEMECDILQNAHHGLGLVAEDIYSLMKPKVVMWHSNWESIIRNHMLEPGRYTARTQTEALKLNLVADTYLHTIPLPYVDGVDEVVKRNINE